MLATNDLVQICQNCSWLCDQKLCCCCQLLFEGTLQILPTFNFHKKRVYSADWQKYVQNSFQCKKSLNIVVSAVYSCTEFSSLLT